MTCLHTVASLDGYIADEKDDGGPLHDWYVNGDHALVDEDVRGMWSRPKVLGGQALSLGLIDHVAIDIVPIVFGRGKPYSGALADGHRMLEDPDVVIRGDGVRHLRYPVRRGRSSRRRSSAPGSGRLHQGLDPSLVIRPAVPSVLMSKGTAQCWVC